MKQLILLTLSLAGCALSPPHEIGQTAPQLTRANAEALLLQSLACVDHDGLTLCDPLAQPRQLRLTRLDCVVEEPANPRLELARLTCAVAGTLIRGNRVRGNRRETEIPGRRVDFFLRNEGGMAYWETGGLYVDRALSQGIN